MIARTLDAKIWAIAWPAIVANISIPLLGLVDAALLGHLDSPLHLAAVAVGGAILGFLYWGFSFLRMGTTGEVARAVGSGDESRALLALGRASLLAVGIAALLLLFGDALLGAGLAVMAPAPDIAATAQTYGSLRLLSAPAVLLGYAAVGWFIGHQDTRWPMRIVISTNIANIGLDALFIVGLGMASTGAALATVIAEYLGLAVAVAGLRRHGLPSLSAPLRRGLFAPRGYGSLLRSHAELFVRTLTLLFAFAFFIYAGEKLGTSVVAANSVMMQFLLFAAFALDGFAYAAEGLSGQALGGGSVSHFHAVTRRCALWSALAALLISVLVLLGSRWLFPLLTSLPGVLEVMEAQSVWLVALPLVAAPSYLLDGVFIGAGETRSMMLTMLFSALAVYLPAWYLGLGWGNHGLWLAFTLFNLARGVTLAACYGSFTRSNRWSVHAPDRPA